jgi:hypothetical protein
MGSLKDRDAHVSCGVDVSRVDWACKACTAYTICSVGTWRTSRFVLKRKQWRAEEWLSHEYSADANLNSDIF